jgi:hypothetical protein
VPIASPRYPFQRVAVIGAPDDPGVYALYEDDRVIYIGYTNGRRTTIRSKLVDHLEQRLAPSSATHYGWEICRLPAARAAELVREHRLMPEPRSGFDFVTALKPG